MVVTSGADDIVSGSVDWLRSQQSCLDAVDIFNIGGKLTPGIFQYRLWVRMEGSEKTSVVIAHDGGWAAPNIYNTMRFPRLLLNVWADPLRDAQKNNIDPAVQRRAQNVFDVFDQQLHRTAGADVMWGTLRILSCVRLTEPTVIEVPDGDGLIRLQAYYAVTQG